MIYLKSKSEQEIMRQGGQILAKILGITKTYVRPGITKKELDNIARRECLNYKVKPSFLGYNDYPAALCVSINDEVVHGIPNDTIIKEGDLVSIDMGVEYNGFHTDSALSLICGNKNGKNREALELIDTTEQCFYTAAKMIKDGVQSGDVAEKMQAIAEAKGYGVIRMLVGHGIGKDVHEEPHFPNFGQAGTGPHLRTGMTIAIEPMLTMNGCVDVILSDDKWTYSTADGSLASHFEHTVLVTDTGCDILTK